MSLNRRSFLQAGAAGALLASRSFAAPEDRPNILWLVTEDMSPTLGCYGDAYAHTPNLDRLAAQSVRYDNAYASAPVCSPARSCLITGVYATTLGTQRLRSQFPIPKHIQGFPTWLREAGYFTTNRTKTDYNTSNAGQIIRDSWDMCGDGGHWRKRKGADTPFFCVFNHMVSHQSRSMVWPYKEFQAKVQSLLSAEERHDPAKAPLPPYYPDTPIVRRTVARSYDCVTMADKQVGELLKQLDDDGLAEDTIVFFYGDHGTGLPRHKRLVLDSGLRVPLLVRFPKKYQHLAPTKPGESTDRLVSFVDFAPTVLSLAGLPIPKHMQGVPFLGKAAGRPREYIYAARDRVDEAYDVARAVRDKRYLYVRNYMPHISYNQPSYYSDLGEIRGEITRLAAAGKLNALQMAYAGPTRPVEELYDTPNDPHQIKNLAASPEHKAVLEKMRKELGSWMRKTRDLGFLPEDDAWRRSKGSTPYDVAKDIPLDDIRAAADLVGRETTTLAQLMLCLEAEEPAIRYWGVVGIAALGKDALVSPPPGEDSPLDALTKALGDPLPSVRIEAAGALARLGKAGAALPVLTKALTGDNATARVHAARTLELLGEIARPVLPAMQAALADARVGKGDGAMFVRFALDTAVKKLAARP